MRPISIKTLAGVVLATAVALSIVGCSKGSDGAAGANGVNGVNGVNGINGTNGTNGVNGVNGQYVLDASSMSATQWMALNPKGTITSVTKVNGQPVVNFKITDQNGFPVLNLDTFTQKAPTATVANFPNFAFYIAKLVGATASSPSRWVNYMVVKPGTTTLQGPNAESTGTMVGHGDGTYTYTFATDISTGAAAVAAGGAAAAALGDVTVDMNAPTRMVIEFYGNARGYGIGRHANTPDGSNGPANAEMTAPINMIYDFVPATGLAPAATAPHREIVATTTCDSCHTVFNYHGGHRVQVQACVTCHTDQRRFGSAGEATISGNAYTSADTQTLNGTAELDFPQLVHKIHMGDSLQMTGYDFQVDSTIVATGGAGTPPNQIRYPQNVANCATCHVASAATPDANNWMVNPSRVACGACHDSVNFTTGLNHGPTNLAQSDDSACATCHVPPSATNNFIAAYHVPVTAPDPTNAGLPASLGGLSSNSHTNPAWVAANNGTNVPTGASVISWNIISTTVVPTSTITPGAVGSTITWTFQIMANGVAQPIQTFNAADSTKWELMPGFVGGPTLYLAYAAPQDGIAAPADYNGTVSVGLHKLWRGGVTQAGNTVTQDATSLNITATYNQATVPTGAGMMTGGVGYFYGVVTQAQLAAATAANAYTLTDNLPLTQINLAAFPYGAFGSTNPLPYQGGLQVPAENAWQLLAGQTARRAIVDTNKCQSCHEKLGTFTDAVFHSGQRNNAETCTFCHNANTTDSGWNYNTKEFIHSLHASQLRTTPYTWQTGHTYWDTTYPAKLNNCEACHVPGSYDLSNAASQAALPNMLWDTVYGSYTGSVLTSDAAYVATTTYVSPFITNGVNYGSAVSFNTGLTAKSNVKWPSNSATPTVITTVNPGASVEADPSTLVSSPLTAACSACHDSSLAASHMKGQGGYIFTPRSNVVTAAATVAGTTVSSPLAQTEACLVCHGTGALADIKAVHMNF